MPSEMLDQAKSRRRGNLRFKGPRGFCRQERMGGGQGALCLYARAPQGCSPAGLWPTLEEAFHTLPPPGAAGTFGLVALPRQVLPEGYLFLYQA